MEGGQNSSGKLTQRQAEEARQAILAAAAAGKGVAGLASSMLYLGTTEYAASATHCRPIACESKKWLSGFSCGSLHVDL